MKNLTADQKKQLAKTCGAYIETPKDIFLMIQALVKGHVYQGKQDGHTKSEYDNLECQVDFLINIHKDMFEKKE